MAAIGTLNLGFEDGNVGVYDELAQYPLPDDKILDWSKLEQFAGDI